VARLDDPTQLEQAMRRAAQAACAVVISATFHRFAGQGVTGVVLLAESHFALHSWPEHGYAAADFYTCGASDPARAVEVLAACLEAQRVDVMAVDRGYCEEPDSMRFSGRWTSAPAFLRPPT
jgi:S-adenosylmethionine decarboxylase proenzyme